MKLSKMLIVVGVAALALGACSSGGSTSSGGTTTTTSPPSAGTSVATAPNNSSVVSLVVAAYRATHPNAPVRVSVQDGTTLGTTIKAKSADFAVLPSLWLKPVQGDLKANPFGNAQAAILVPAANPKNITSAQAFAPASGLRVKACGVSSGVGNFAAIVLRRASVVAAPGVVAEGCEKAAAAQVAAGTLDAVLLFKNGFKVPAGTKLISIPAAQNLVFDFSWVQMRKSAQADAFATYLASPQVKAILTASGYLP